MTIFATLQGGNMPHIELIARWIDARQLPHFLAIAETQDRHPSTATATVGEGGFRLNAGNDGDEAHEGESKDGESNDLAHGDL